MNRFSYYFILMIFTVLIIQQDISAQWIDLTDETSTRLQLTTVPDNDAEEKDIAIGDLNQDGWTDIVIVRKNPFSSPGPKADVLLMNENGVLIDRTNVYAPEFISRQTDARDVYIGDFDADGWLDVVVASTFEDQPQYYRNLGEDGGGNWLGFANESSSRFPVLTVNPLQFCALWAGDVDGNKAPDIYFSNYDPSGTSQDVLLINDGTGHFTDESAARLGNLRNSAFGTSVEIHDMDNDGDNDIIKTSTLFSVPPFNEIGTFILFNDGTGHFSNYEPTISFGPYMFTIGYLNSDNLPDIYLVDDQQDYINFPTSVIPDVEIQFNFQELQNSPHTTGFGGNVKMADLDNDGDPDVGVASVDVDIPPCESGGFRKFCLLRNEGSFTGVLNDPWGSVNNAWNNSDFDFAFIDINNDGQIDIFDGICQGYKVFMQNTCNVDPATNPDPADGEINVPVDIQELTWSNGAGAISNELYFGTDPDNLNLVQSGTLATSWTVNSTLEFSTTYYWQVVEIGDTCQRDGNIWQFSTESDPNITCFINEIFADLSQWTIAGPMGFSNWSISNTSNAGGSSPELDFTWTPSFVGNSYIMSEIIPTDGIQLTVTFNHMLDWFADPCGPVGAAFTTDDGATWTSIWEITPTGNVGPETKIITGVPGNNNFRLGFYYSGDSFNIDDWYIDNVSVCGVIPVELSAFSASVESNTVLLNWKTASELNNSGFEVQRTRLHSQTVNDADWQKIGFVPGFGTSSEPRSYSLTDKNLSSGTYVYRLKQIDYNGNFEYSQIIEVEIKNPLSFSLEQNYPNPFNPVTTIKYSIPEDELVQLTVFNMLGETVKQLVNEKQAAGDYHVLFNAEDLPSGVYIYRIKAGQFNAFKKLILMK